MDKKVFLCWNAEKQTMYKKTFAPFAFKFKMLIIRHNLS